MYELFDASIAIVGAIYCYLTAIGVVKLRKPAEEAKLWRAKYGTFLKLVAVALFIFGAFKVYQHAAVL